MNTGVQNNELDGVPIEYSSGEEEEQLSESHDEVLEASRRAQKERPITCANMEDIKTRFESGKLESREERREEQKKELQTIRSRLFMGKQAKIKEMYQQAVADSESPITNASGNKLDVDMDLEKTRSIKEKFEKGAFRGTDDRSRVSEDEMAVFEQGFSKESRSHFQELDANMAKQPQSLPSPVISQSGTKTLEKRRQYEQTCADVKSGEKSEECHIETADISNKFKFFETYRPEEKKKKEFRITPPREGVVKVRKTVWKSIPFITSLNRCQVQIRKQKNTQTAQMASIIIKTKAIPKMIQQLRPKLTPPQRCCPFSDKWRRINSSRRQMAPDQSR